MEKLMAVVMEDAKYSYSLCESLSGANILNYKIIAFYDLDEYEFFRSMNGIDVLLITKSLIPNLGVNSEKHIFILSEDKRCSDNEIFMYQNTDEIVKEICFRVRASSRDKISENHPFKTYCVCSSKGGGGTTTTAITLSLLLGLDKSILFVSLDPFITMTDMKDEMKDLVGGLIYNLKVHKNLWTMFAEKNIRSAEGFDYIAGMNVYEDLSSLSKEDMRNFFAGIAEDGRYEAIVFDLGYIPGCSSVIMEKSEFLLMLGNEEERETQNKIRQLKIVNEAVKIKVLQPEFDSLFSEKNLQIRKYRGTKLYSQLKKLLESEKRKITDNVSDFSEKNELVVMESKEYKPKKLSLRKLLFLKE